MSDFAKFVKAAKKIGQQTVFNPRTGRQVKVDGAVAKRVFKQGKLKFDGTMYIDPENTRGYIKVPPGYANKNKKYRYARWMKRGTKDSKEVEVLFKPKREAVRHTIYNPATDRLIAIGKSTYNRLDKRNQVVKDAKGRPLYIEPTNLEGYYGVPADIHKSLRDEKYEGAKYIKQSTYDDWAKAKQKRVTLKKDVMLPKMVTVPGPRGDVTVTEAFKKMLELSGYTRTPDVKQPEKAVYEVIKEEDTYTADGRGNSNIFPLREFVSAVKLSELTSAQIKQVKDFFNEVEMKSITNRLAYATFTADYAGDWKTMTFHPKKTKYDTLAEAIISDIMTSLQTYEAQDVSLNNYKLTLVWIGNPDQPFGFVRDDLGRNCAITAIHKHFKEHNYKLDVKKFPNGFHDLYNRYRLGVFFDDFKDISAALRLRIEIKDTVAERVWEFGKHIKDKKKLMLSYAGCHHVDVHKMTDKNTTVELVHNIDIVDVLLKYRVSNVGQLIGSIDDLLQITVRVRKPGESDDDKYIIIRRKDCDVNGEFCTPNTGMAKRFLKLNKITPIDKSNPNLETIKYIPSHGITYAKTVYSGKAYELDLKKAYDNYENFDYYSGFPRDLSYMLTTENMTFEKIMEIVKNNEGFALIEQYDLYTGKKGKRWVSFPYLRFYMEERVESMKVFYLLVARNKCDKLQIPEKDMPDAETIANMDPDRLAFEIKRATHMMYGLMTKTKAVKCYLSDDVRFATDFTCSPLIAHVEEYDDDEKDEFVVREQIYVIKQTVNRISSTYAPFISGYVHFYTEIMMEKLYMELVNVGLEDKIIRVWVDGICIEGEQEMLMECLNKIDLVRHLFHLKYKKVECNFTSNPAWLNKTVPEVKKCGSTFVPILQNIEANNILISGMPGTGKTTYMINLKECTSCTVLLPKYELFKHHMKKNPNSFSDSNVMVYQKLMAMPPMFRKSVAMKGYVLIDEYYEIPDGTIRKLEKSLRDFNPNVVIVMCGDPGQLSPVNGSPISIRTKKMFHHIELCEIFRQKDKKFVKDLIAYRKKQKSLIDIVDKDNTISFKDLHELEGAIILLPTHRLNNAHTLKHYKTSNEEILMKGLKKSMTCRVNKSTKLKGIPRCGRILTAVGATDDAVNFEYKDYDDKLLTCTIKKKYIGYGKDNIVKIQHNCFTVHSIQGTTLDKKVAIYPANATDFWNSNERSRMDYVSMTRVKRRDQLYLVKDDDSIDKILKEMSGLIGEEDASSSKKTLVKKKKKYIPKPKRLARFTMIGFGSKIKSEVPSLLV